MPDCEAFDGYHSNSVRPMNAEEYAKSIDSGIATWKDRLQRLRRRFVEFETIPFFDINIRNGLLISGETVHVVEELKKNYNFVDEALIQLVRSCGQIEEMFKVIWIRKSMSYHFYILAKVSQVLFQVGKLPYSLCLKKISQK